MSRVEYSGATEYRSPAEVPQEYQSALTEFDNVVRVAADSGRPLERIRRDGRDVTVYRRGVEPETEPTDPIAEFGTGDSVESVASSADRSIVNRVSDALPVDSPDFGVVSELDGVTSVGVRDAQPGERIESINLHGYDDLVAESWFSGPSTESVAMAQARLELGEYDPIIDDEQGDRGQERRQVVREESKELADDYDAVEASDARRELERAASDDLDGDGSVDVEAVADSLDTDTSDISRKQAAGAALAALVGAYAIARLRQ